MDPYASCTCGSGKKFKWCCGPIHEQLERAFRLFADGQHEASLRMVDDIVKAHPDNPEVHGRRALLLFQLGRDEEGEKTLEQAFQLNPNYAYGHYLRGRVRQEEGEFEGALLLFRKAAELYDPSAQEILATLFTAIAECEMHLNRPVAGRAALDIAAAQSPRNTELRKSVEVAFGDESALPLSARKPYSLKGPRSDAAPERKELWQQALGQHTTGRLRDAQQAFEQLLATDGEDAPAWFNLGLVKAWLGDNVAALQALDEYVRREPIEADAASAWTLAEVLRCGAGVPENDTDHVEYDCTYQIRDPGKVQKLLGELEQSYRLIAPQVDQQRQVLTAVVAEPPKLLAAGSGPPKVLHYAGHLAVVQHLLRISSTVRQKLLLLAAEFEEKTAGGLQARREGSGPVPMPHLLIEAMDFPITDSEDEFKQRMAEGAARFFEEVWLHRPLRALSGIPPVDAAGHAVLRKKLLGVVQFQEDAARVQKLGYDFNQLRRKLGLFQTPAATAPAGAPDIAALSAAELAALPIADLTDQQLELAQQTARKLDARELAASFLEALVQRPPQAGKPDRLGWYSPLIQHALDSQQNDRAMEFVDAGEKSDCEHNEGRRRNDYELWRGRVHARRGELDQAQDVFDRLIARAPGEMRFRTTAAEAMLSAKDPARALRFAQEGVTAARQHKDRDSEQHLMELAEAAKKRGAL